MHILFYSTPAIISLGEGVKPRSFVKIQPLSPQAHLNLLVLRLSSVIGNTVSYLSLLK